MADWGTVRKLMNTKFHLQLPIDSFPPLQMESRENLAEEEQEMGCTHGLKNPRQKELERIE